MENDTSSVDLLVKNIVISEDGTSATLYHFDETTKVVSDLKKIYSWNDEDILNREKITSIVDEFVPKGILLSGDTNVLLKLDSGDTVDLSSTSNVFDVEIWKSGMFYSSGSVVYYNGSRYLSSSASETAVEPVNNLSVWTKVSDSDLFSRACELYDTRLHAVIKIGEYSDSVSEYSTVDSIWKMLFNMETDNITDDIDLKNVLSEQDGSIAIENGMIGMIDSELGAFGFKTILTKGISVSTFSTEVSIPNCDMWDTSNPIEFILTGAAGDNESRTVYDYHSITAVSGEDDATTLSYHHENRKTEDNEYSVFQEPVVITDESNLPNKTFIVSFNINNDIVFPMVELKIPHVENNSGVGRISPEFTMSDTIIDY